MGFGGRRRGSPFAPLGSTLRPSSFFLVEIKGFCTFLSLLVVLWATSSHAITRTALGGRWSDAENWCPDGVPEEGDSVIIEDVNVLFDTVTPRLRLIDIRENGALYFDNGNGESDTELQMVAETIVVAGYLEMGREDDLFTRKARVILINHEIPPLRADDPAEKLFVEPYGTKMIGVFKKGRWEAHAKGRNPIWTKLDGDVSAGQRNLTVLDDVDWKVGDKIIVTSTDLNPEQTEEHYISSINGREITLEMPFRFGHFGRVLSHFGYELDMRAEVAVLSSNLVIEGDLISSPNYTETNYEGYEEFLVYGGHTISVQDSLVRMQGIEFKNLGQGSRLARYPVHWHHRGDARGQYIKRCSIHISFSRSVTVHDTRNLLVQDVVAYDVIGHSVYLEDGTEEGNQFIHNLIVNSRPVGTGSADHESGAWKFPDCSYHPPGLRLNFLDFDPSGFWITNVNNTFVGNVAVGHTYGFWIRVDLVFNEPGFPCTVCQPSCVLPREDLPTVSGTNLIFVDNVAHSNREAGWWIKENWVPDGGQNIISGFLVYKNRIGGKKSDILFNFEVENYGIAHLKFDHIIAADNAVGATIDWIREGSTTFSDSLFIGETENHGNPSDPNWSDSTSCSVIFPGISRTQDHRGGLPNMLFKIGDRHSHLHNVILANQLPTCEETVEPHVTSYPGGNNLGAFQHTDRLSQPLPPDRLLSEVYFVNTSIVQAWPGDDNLLHMGGYLDVNGTLPCSTPGSWWLYNVSEIMSKDCEYRSNYNMWVCPPFEGAYRQLNVRVRRGYQWYAWTGDLYADWECDYFFTMKTNKLYHLRFETPDPPGIAFDPVVDPEVTNFEGIELVIEYPGPWTFEYYSVDWPNWTPDPSNLLEVQCQCNVTYARIRVNHIGGNELRANVDHSRECGSTCGNPFPIPSPTGYTCGQAHPTSSNKDFQTCSVPAPPNQARDWPTWPNLPSLGTLQDTPAYSTRTKQECTSGSASLVHASLIFIFTLAFLF